MGEKKPHTKQSLNQLSVYERKPAAFGRPRVDKARRHVASFLKAGRGEGGGENLEKPKKFFF